ncbi:unnamed protein product [Allacma fusca]|uniref:Uncharacterized protein n=1 Tax=Allacma fusca TaxID=39272 RepID=A0A8J2PCH4_9HEXA|nr:unnamed protein product [Allacma fusca]
MLHNQALYNLKRRYGDVMKIYLRGLFTHKDVQSPWQACSGQGAQEDASPIAIPGIVGNPREDVNATAPKQEFDPSDRTTTRPRIPLPYEKNTKTLIQLSNQTMDALQMYLVRYDTQLNLNALDSLIPVLKKIQRNLTNLLARSDQVSQTVFQQEKLFLDEKMSQVETQIQENRLLMDHYELIHQMTNKQLGTVYKSLGAILSSQVYILGMKHNINPHPQDDSEIKAFIDYQFNRLNYTSKLKIIHDYIKNLPTAPNRLVGYTQFMTKFNYFADPDDSLGIGVQVARDIFTFPELKTLRESLPSLLRMLFTDTPKILKLNSEGKMLGIGDLGVPSVVTSIGSDVKRWKFYPLDDYPFFAIVDSKSNQALGHTMPVYNTFALLRFDDALQLREEYHWRIYTIVSSRGGLFLFFINRHTNHIMGYLTDLYADEEGYSGGIFNINQWSLISENEDHWISGLDKMGNYRWRLLIFLVVLPSPAYCYMGTYNGQDESDEGNALPEVEMSEPEPFVIPREVWAQGGTTTNSPVPEATTVSTTTTTTTATPSTTRRPLAFEKYTSGLIRNSNDTISQLQMDLLKYESQLNLNTLNTLLPVLEEIRKNMSTLLRSSNSDHRTFQEQSLTLDHELSEIENQIKKNRELQEHYETIQESTKEQLGMVYSSLGNLLNSQIYILAFKQNPKSSKPKSDSEIRLFIDHTLTFTAKKFSLSNASLEVYTYLKGLETESNRLTGYSYFLSEMTRQNASQGITFEFVRDVYNYPELTSLRDLVPSMLGLIFSDGPKGIKSLYVEKMLNVGSGSSIEFATTGAESAKRWKFTPQEGSYFSIIDSTTNQALGIVSTRRSYYSDEIKSLGLLRYDVTTQLNSRYQWKILATTYLSKTYLSFVNRELSGYALGVESGAPAVSSYASYYSNVRWELN